MESPAPYPISEPTDNPAPAPFLDDIEAEDEDIYEEEDDELDDDDE